MADFYDLESLFTQLDRDIPDYMMDIAIKIQADMRLFWLESVYASKSPNYDYTDDLLESTRISKPKKVGNEWVVEIYIDQTAHTNKAWYNEMGFSVGDEVPISAVADRMFEIGRSGDIMEEMSQKYLDNSEALKYVINKLRSKYDIA